ncbi:hypothetical protein C8N46_108161 [Kordia periserrulae]|uniref:Lipocalin-like protein n=1 Tax=Kordia periserrulae TaxID=701523 RepID=A0A2T6BUU8_9FLAO|nr:hypothetical protein [Kordia periserrulae]PTX59848.1 hypothetical protein C8N46_108161 [Kordia periserrulae]
MKHLKTLLFAVLIFSFLSFQKTADIIGKWEMFKMESAEGDVRESSGNWMEFVKGGLLKGGNSLETTDRTGEWQFNEATSEVTISSEEKRSGEGTFKVTWMDDTTIYITVDRGNKVYLRRVK